jgi:hypothetical protein
MTHGWNAGVTGFDCMGSPVMPMRRTETMTSLMAELSERLVDHRWTAPATDSHVVRLEMHSCLPRPDPARSVCPRPGD